MLVSVIEQKLIKTVILLPILRIPILKNSKNPRALTNFCPITLTRVLCKLTEHLIVIVLIFYLEKFNFLSDRQAEFRKD